MQNHRNKAFAIMLVLAISSCTRNLPANVAEGELLFLSFRQGMNELEYSTALKNEIVSGRLKKDAKDTSDVIFMFYYPSNGKTDSTQMLFHGRLTPKVELVNTEEDYKKWSTLDKIILTGNYSDMDYIFNALSEKYGEAKISDVLYYETGTSSTNFVDKTRYTWKSGKKVIFLDKPLHTKTYFYLTYTSQQALDYKRSVDLRDLLKSKVEEAEQLLKDSLNAENSKRTL